MARELKCAQAINEALDLCMAKDPRVYVMGLGATSGQQITIRAAGPDAREAVAAMIDILAAATPVGG